MTTSQGNRLQAANAPPWYNGDQLTPSENSGLPRVVHPNISKHSLLSQDASSLACQAFPLGATLKTFSLTSAVPSSAYGIPQIFFCAKERHSEAMIRISLELGECSPPILCRTDHMILPLQVRHQASARYVFCFGAVSRDFRSSPECYL